MGADNARECVVASVVDGASPTLKRVYDGAISVAVSVFPVLDRRRRNDELQLRACGGVWFGWRVAPDCLGVACFVGC